MGDFLFLSEAIKKSTQPQVDGENQYPVSFTAFTELLSLILTSKIISHSSSLFALKLTREHNQSDHKDHFISDYINWQGDNQTTSSCRMTARVTTTGTRLGTTQKS